MLTREQERQDNHQGYCAFCGVELTIDTIHIHIPKPIQGEGK